ncbi:MAG: amylo-alpha-1,6-glucosidase [Phycisphaeraceae bacterium]
MTRSRTALPVYHIDAPTLSPRGGPEWLLTNGTGAFAMGTALGCNTRRYHGFFLPATKPPVGRINAVSFIAPTLHIDGQIHELFNCEFAAPGPGPGSSPVFHPHGHNHLVAFAKTPTTVAWTHRVGDIELVQTLRLIWKKQLGVMRYELRRTLTPSPPGGGLGRGDARHGDRETDAGRDSTPPHPNPLPEGEGTAPDRLTLSLRPFLAMRDFHALRHAYDLPIDAQSHGSSVTVTNADLPPLFMQTDTGRFIRQPDWWHNFHYRIDADRQQDCTESLWTPGSWDITFDIRNLQPVTLAFGIDPIDWPLIQRPDRRVSHLRKLIEQTIPPLPLGEGGGEGSLKGEPVPSKRQPKSNVPSPQPSPIGGGSPAALVAASDDFVVDRTVAGKPSTTIIAGYPWFSDWGRDTMIALPGCLLVTGRHDEASDTLLTFAAHIRDGLIPNRFDDYGEDPHYNTVDASLWFIHACLEYVRITGDRKTWSAWLQPACERIITAYQQGTRFAIGMSDDGLIHAGNPLTQLTWMDAARDGVVFTPRWGKAVEINALWYRALTGCVPLMPAVIGRPWAALAKKVKRSFNAVFWNEKLGCLFDHVNIERTDASLRPNQMFAVSLGGDLLSPARRKQIMRIVRERLYTPMGIRTLPADDANYHARFTGSMFERDRAYHQGTVWQWLIGPFIEGWLRADDFSEKARAESRDMLAPLIAQLDKDSLGQLHEVADADAPHLPSGCPAQAWSVAETLRAAMLIENK